MDNRAILTEKWSLNLASIRTDLFHHLEFFIEYHKKFIFFFGIIKESP
jgi:hypothetical protein